MTNQDELIRLLYELTLCTLKWYIADDESYGKPEAYQTDYNGVKIKVRQGPYYLLRGILYQIQSDETVIYESFDLVRLWESVRRAAKEQARMNRAAFVAAETEKVVRALRKEIKR